MFFLTCDVSDERRRTAPGGAAKSDADGIIGTAGGGNIG